MTAREDYDRRKTGEKVKRDKEAAESWRYKLKDPITAFTGVLALVACLQTCILKQSDITLRDTLSANEAIQMPFVTIRSLKVESGDKLRYRDPAQKYWSFKPEFENSGSTITRNLQIYPAYVVASAPGEFSLDQLQSFIVGNQSRVPHAPIDPALIKEASRYKDRNLVLGPHAKQIVGGISLSADFLKRPNNAWFAFGIATYNDIFSQTSHVTKYCYEILGLNGSDEAPNIAACSHWNCADQECEADKASYDRQAGLQ
jgi:hypothetical protein